MQNKSLTEMSYEELLSYVNSGIHYKNAKSVYETLNLEKTDLFGQFSLRQRAELATAFGGVMRAASLASNPKLQVA